jgi:hypothetical protein
MSIAALLPHLPLFERLQVLARLHGEKLRPAVYAVPGDAGAIGQNVILRPPSNEGDLILHDMTIAGADSSRLPIAKLDVNGVQYFGTGVRLDAIPNALNAPIVVRVGNQAVVALTAGASTFGTLVGYFSGFHCSTRFSELVRRSGELFASQRTFTSVSGAQEIQLTRHTLLDAIIMPTTGQTITEMWIRIADKLMTPIAFTSEPTQLFSPDRGMGRSGSTAVVNPGVSPRCQVEVPAGNTIRMRCTTSGTVVLVALGRQVYAQ